MATNNITAPPSPDISLGLRMQVTSGRNQIQQAEGNYAALYLVPNSRIVKRYLELRPGEIYNSNPGESTNNLILSTTEKLSFLGDLEAGGVVNFQVNKALAFDDPITSFSFSNAGVNVARVQMNSVNYTTLPLVAAIFYGAAVPPAIYSEAFITGLSNRVDGPKDRTVVITSGPGEKTYYCYPVVYGESNFTVNGFTGGISIVAITTVDTGNGPAQYYVYESDYPDLGATTIIVTGA